MKLSHLRLCNFQSFGSAAVDLEFEGITFLIGPNGAGKTATLEALSRLFGFNPNGRYIRGSDFHVPVDEKVDAGPLERSLYIEAEFTFPELRAVGGDHPTIPPYFSHMRLDSADGVPRVRFRLDAKMDSAGDVEDVLSYVLDIDANGQPLTKHPVPRSDRNNIHIHYLPARRDPSDQISYAANSMLGRALRSANWQTDRQDIAGFTKQIGDRLRANLAVKSLSDEVATRWKALHTGTFFTDPEVTFVEREMETLLRHVSVSFAPGHGERLIDFSRLSDGQKSLLYLTLVLAIQRTGRAILQGTEKAFDVEKFKPAIFTLFAVEEPENSLSPHYLGRVVESLKEFSNQDDAQSVIATQSPSMLKRVSPENIRYLRLSELRQTSVRRITLPSEKEESYKFVREAVQAFPELYFSRLVILGEGDTEEIILARLIQAAGLAMDQSGICIVPLGGRHINHFWRLLTALEIPFVTLLDLDWGRYQGGWGRIKYVAIQLQKFAPTKCGIKQKDIDGIPAWDASGDPDSAKFMSDWADYLEKNDVFFSSPLDLDFAMLTHFPKAYDVEKADLVAPNEASIKAVLGEHYYDIGQYSDAERKLFSSYHRDFQLANKPAAHLAALAKLSDATLLASAPKFLVRLSDAIYEKIKTLPE